MAGRQPLTQAQPSMAGFTPQGVMGMNQATYAPQMSGWQTQQNLAQQQSMMNQQLPFQYMSGIGGLMGGIGGSGGWL